MLKSLLTILASALSLSAAAQTQNLSLDSKGRVCISDGASLWFANTAESQWISTEAPGRDTCLWMSYIAPKSLVACSNANGAGRLYMSFNNGKSWKLRKMKDKPFSAAFFSDAAGLWVAFSDMTLIHTVNQGSTWKTVNAPASSDSHITSICMLSMTEGLLGCTANKILRTSDGGKSFQSVTTPLDQAHRNDGYYYGDGSVTNVMRIGRWYVVKQGDYFITSYDNVQWQHMKDVTYAALTEAGTLMTVTSDNKVQEYDDKLSRSWKRSLTSDKALHTVSSVAVDQNYAYVCFDDRLWRSDGDSATVFTPTDLEGNHIAYTPVAVKSTEPEQPIVKHSAEYNAAVAAFNAENYDKAFPLLSALSESGENEILEDLAYCYEDGKGTTQDYAKAIQLYSKAAQNGSSYAMFNMGYFFMNGWAVQKDTVKALALWDKAADRGYDFANQDLADYYTYEGNYEMAARYLSKSVAKGNKQAIYKYAIYNFDGIGMKQDSIAGFEYLKKAADMDVADAQTYIGDTYLNGGILPKNTLLGIYYIEKGMENGDKYATKFLAKAYLAGNGVDLNNKKGFQLLKQAADAGDEETYKGLATCYTEGCGTNPDPEMAIHYLELAQKAGDPTAADKIKDIHNAMIRSKESKK